MSFRRELLERVGGFDERLIGTSSFDDADMALRIKKLGYKIVFSPQACLKHVFADKGGCRDMDFAEKMYWYYRNLTILYLKYMKRIFLPLVLLRQCIGVCRRSLASRDCKTFLFSTMGLICGFRDFKNKLRLRDIDRKTVKKILLTRTQGMGDVICFIPLLKTLRKEFPQASITLVTGRPGGREIMQGCPFVDKVVFYDVEKTRSVLGKVDFIIKLRKEKFDLLITSSQEVGFALKAFLSGAKYRLGFREYETNNIKSRDKFWFLHTVALEPLKSEHEVDANLRLLDILGIEEKDNSLSIWIRQEDEIFAKDLFKEYDLIHKPVIAISPFAGRAVKNWPKERYAELISDLEKNKKARVILIGPRYTLGGNEEIIRLGATESLNLSGRTTIGQLIALLSRCDLFIGSDSGPMNIAAALNIPVIALFGPGDENRYRPRCDHSLVINKRLECAPCNKQACERPRCMELISVNEVLKEVGHLLAKISKKQSR